MSFLVCSCQFSPLVSCHLQTQPSLRLLRGSVWEWGCSEEGLPNMEYRPVKVRTKSSKRDSGQKSSVVHPNSD